MALNETQQFTELIKKSSHVLIVFKKEFTIDAVAAALGLYSVLKKQNKLVDIICPDFVLPKNLKFLPNAEIINPKLETLQKLIITVDADQEQIEEFSYNFEANKLKIFITPKTGGLNEEKVKIESSQFKYDLIITLDTADLNALGAIYQNFTQFFFDTNIINIDHHSDNEQYGQINITNLNAVATSEILFDLINSIDKNLLDAEIATCLLTGLVAKTKSFKTPNVTPTTLGVASALMTAEADRDTIIKNLYRSRSLATLNLWGRVLARLRNDGDSKLIWSLLTDNDFVEAKADQKDLSDVIDELISFMPGVEIVVLIYQLNGSINVLVHTLKGHNALYLASTFNPEGSKNSAQFQISNQTLADAETEVIAKIKERLGQK
ncbi:MAG: DHH family phosphoesterase [Patescibacteria group bacterium]|nr:DHH family phosphoesterase [Patescibacteria group bacterium]